MSLRNTATNLSTNATKNNVGTDVFKVPDHDRFVRALTIGTDAGTFYVSKESLANEVVDFMRDYITRNPKDAISTMVEVSSSGRAPKEVYNLFALALAFTIDDDTVRNELKDQDAFTKMVRTTFHLTEFIKNFRALDAGWGRSRTRAVASWYENKTADQLGFQVAKYPSRGGYSHLDLIRLSHPKNLDENLVDYIKSSQGMDVSYDADKLPQVVQNLLKVSNMDDPGDVVAAIKDTDGTFQWEFLRTEMLNYASVWRTLLKGGHVGYRALMWNLGRFSKLGMLKDKDDLKLIRSLIKDKDAVKNSRIHPMNILNALVGVARAENGSDPSGYDYFYRKENTLKSPVSQALEDALTWSYGNVEATDKKLCLAVDVSGSMDWSSMDGRNALKPRQIASMFAAMLLNNEDEDDVDVFAFDHNYTQLDVDNRTSLTSFLSKTDNLNFGSTDASLPFRHALKNNDFYDAIVVLTDNDTYCSTTQGLKEYRKKVNPEAKLVVVSISGGNFSINDPDDPNGLDVSGFDAGALNYVVDFIADRVS